MTKDEILNQYYPTVNHTKLGKLYEPKIVMDVMEEYAQSLLSSKDARIAELEKEVDILKARIEYMNKDGKLKY